MKNAKRAWVDQWFGGTMRQCINGELKKGGGEPFTVTNPATGQQINSYHCAAESEVNGAIVSARLALKGEWSQWSRRERADALKKLGEIVATIEDELATVETCANGKLYKEALLDDMPDASSIFDYYSGWIDKYAGESLPVEQGFVNYTRIEPVGVCALIVPWNFPFLLACWKIAPALAMGNTIIVKPSEYTPYSMIRFIEAVQEAGVLPPGVFNVLLGEGKVGAQLANHHGVDKVSFTGSTAVGRKIVNGSAGSNLKRVTLELGGKSPNIFFDDTPELDAAIARQYTAMFSHKGEKCSEPTRLLVQDKIYDRVVEQLAARANSMVCGDPFDSASQQGAQCNQAQFEKIMGYITYGQEDGARLVAGGQRDVVGSNGQGLFIRPTIFADVDNKIRISQEEIFGPVLSVTRFKTEEEAVQIANDTSYGLAAGFYTGDVSRAHRVAAQLDAGMVFVNQYGCYDFASPFGGFKQSGWGKEMARQSLEAYTKQKSVWIKY